MLGLRGRCGFLNVESEALRNNPLGNHHVRILPVYLPELAGADPRQRFPVVYFLPSYGSDARSIISVQAWEENFFQRVDRLISQGLMAPAFVVAVDGWTHLGGSQYVDSQQNGAYATFVIQEVIAAVDAALPTIAHSGSRALIGKSSGGFGALHLAMRYPGYFTAIAAHSADGSFAYSAQPAFVSAWRELRAAGGIKHFIAQWETSEERSAAARDTMLTLAYAAAYSPSSTRPLDIDLPFHLASGEVRADVFARWLAFDPVEALQTTPCIEAMRTLAFCYLDCGTKDEFALDLATSLVATKLRNAGVPVLHEEYNGKHRGSRSRYDRSLPLLVEALQRA